MADTTGTQYVIDFGLDLDVGAERIGFPISAGLVTVTNPDTGEGDPQWFTKMKAGDSIAYRIWDHTAGPSKTARLVAFRATWVDPTRFNDLASPLADSAENPSVFSGVEIQPVDAEQARSSVYSLNRGGWIFGDPATAPPPLGMSFAFADAPASLGAYYLRARLDVVIDETIMRTFHWDPEIIVGAGGGGGEP